MGICPGYLSLPEGTLCFCRPQLAFLDHGRCVGVRNHHFATPNVDNAMERRFLFVNELEADQQGFFGVRSHSCYCHLGQTIGKTNDVFVGVFFSDIWSCNHHPCWATKWIFFACHKCWFGTSQRRLSVRQWGNYSAVASASPQICTILGRSWGGKLGDEPQENSAGDFFGMVKTWPFQRLLVTSNDRGSKGHGLNRLDGMKWCSENPSCFQQ